MRSVRTAVVSRRAPDIYVDDVGYFKVANGGYIKMH